MSKVDTLEDALLGAHSLEEEVNAWCAFAPGSTLHEARSGASLEALAARKDVKYTNVWYIAEAAKKLLANGLSFPRGAKTLAAKALKGDKEAEASLSALMQANELVMVVKHLKPAQGMGEWTDQLVAVGDTVGWYDRHPGFGSSQQPRVEPYKVVALDPKKRQVRLEYERGAWYVPAGEIFHNSYIGQAPVDSRGRRVF